MSLEMDMDKYLKIKTSGRDDSNSDFTNYPYEPTPYIVLNELYNSGYITKKDKIIDYGCGKGRVDFYLANYAKSKMIGIEYDQRLYNKALDNYKTAISSNRVKFYNVNAMDFVLEDDINKAYFFNPFSTVVLKKVLENIIDSIKRCNREFMLFFYYPSKDYNKFLENNSCFELIDIINCKSLFNSDDDRECILVYKIISL